MSIVAPNFIDNFTRVVSIGFFAVSTAQILNPVGATHFFGFEGATQRESRLMPVVAGRNLSVGLAMLSFSFANDRRAFGILATGMTIAGLSDIYALWAYGGKKLGGHVIGTCSFMAIGALLLMNS